MDALLVACRPCWLVRRKSNISFAFWKKFESCFIVRHRAIGLPQPSNSFSAVFQDWLFLTLHLLPLHHDHFHSLSTFNASRLSQIQGAVKRWILFKICSNWYFVVREKIAFIEWWIGEFCEMKIKICKWQPQNPFRVTQKRLMSCAKSHFARDSWWDKPSLLVENMQSLSWEGSTVLSSFSCRLHNPKKSITFHPISTHTSFGVFGLVIPW